MADESFEGQTTQTSPGRTWGALTPSDTVDFTFVPKAIQCIAGAGTFVAVDEDDNTGTFYASAGHWLPIRPKRINATGLTAGLQFTGLKK